MKKASSSVKSGTESASSKGDFVATLGGQPPSKEIKAINAANTPKSAPRSVGK